MIGIIIICIDIFIIIVLISFVNAMYVIWAIYLKKSPINIKLFNPVRIYK